MKSWPSPSLPDVPGDGAPLHLHDTSRNAVAPVDAGPVATMYVCGVTPYDTTHMGHAATYVTFDLVGRVLRDAGHEVRYVQNVTDVDDPLFERAARDGVDWEELATEQIALFHEDMTALSVIPPTVYAGVVESMPEIIEAVEGLVARGVTYTLPVDAGTPADEGGDVYLDLSTVPSFGSVSHWSRAEMMAVFADRGGDPERPAKRDALDPLLWRAHRDGEPAWDSSVLGSGRPGWHIECTALAVEHLGVPFDIQGGGTDLTFPHHEMSQAQSDVLTGTSPFARFFVHQAMVAFDGEKMSKSKGNLVRVSQLRDVGVDPRAIRLVLLGQHYRSEWEWTADLLDAAEARLDAWTRAVSLPSGPSAESTIASVRSALADDLDSPDALAAIDRWVDHALTRGGSDAHAPGAIADLTSALLGVDPRA
ncbi:cysteine--1-D-myo-inosityl 2-amino-2-deoxy-alpha-D-glucopyranoside ligase [Janibacter sp. G1551]|uniref:cysteine--1-D-myo-inosityl 2-amino-2-deoxy-alpha-D-glucopyranoside ligase n=1 Tax=Janibacter sp. G1551 TaxID=3420440 RepID=UPI003D04BEEA